MSSTSLNDKIPIKKSESWRDLIYDFDYQLERLNSQIASKEQSEKEKGKPNKRRQVTARRNWSKLTDQGCRIMLTLASPPPGLWPDTLAILAEFRGGLKVFLNTDYGPWSKPDFLDRVFFPLQRVSKAVVEELTFFHQYEIHAILSSRD